MSASVDVLAVLDALCERAASGDPAEYRELNSLRYAVSELITASERVQNQVDPLLHSNGYGYVGAMAGHRRALARARGLLHGR